MNQKITGIYSERNRYKNRSWQIVYEWEDIITQYNRLKIHNLTNFNHKVFNIFRRLKLESIYKIIDKIAPVSKYQLYYVMTANVSFRYHNQKKIIPIIIDFWLEEEDFHRFYKLYSNSKFLLISSKEVYEKLRKSNCPLELRHFPLSIPDQYISNDRINTTKTFDFLFAGRVNPIFWEFVTKFEKEFPDIEYIYQELDGIKPYYISNKKGILKEDYLSRENYARLLSEAKFSFYSTPGLDPAKEGANGYNQVTPRFLELIASGCIVLGQYPTNADTDFYEMSTYCINIGGYDDFKTTVNKYLNNDIADNHRSKYYSYLKNHSSSHTASIISNLMND